MEDLKYTYRIKRYSTRAYGNIENVVEAVTRFLNEYMKHKNYELINIQWIRDTKVGCECFVTYRKQVY